MIEMTKACKFALMKARDLRCSYREEGVNWKKKTG